MKASKFNFFYPLEDGQFLAYNSLKNGLAVVDSSVQRSVQHPDDVALAGLAPEARRELCAGGFLVENDFDEVRYLCMRRRSAQFASTHLQLTVAPTLACNLACTYCYETAEPGVMKHEVQDRIVQMVGNHVDDGVRSVQLCWYGGEPLLAMPVIERLSKALIELCDGRGVKYGAHIVTNATLYTRETAEKLKAWRVEYAQVTIDGDRATHDQRRPFRGGRGSFDTILANLQATMGLIPLSIRINLDRANADQAIDFYKNLFSQPWFDPQAAFIYYGHIQKYTSSCKCADEEVLKNQDFCAKQLELAEFLAAKGLGFTHYPTPGNGCGATSEHAVVIGPRGELYKCWNNPGVKEYEIGSIFEPLQPTATLVDYLTEGFESDPECLECKVLPICMGGCVDVRIQARRAGQSNKDCTKWRYYLEESLRRYYLHHLASQQAPPTAEVASA